MSKLSKYLVLKVVCIGRVFETGLKHLAENNYCENIILCKSGLAIRKRDVVVHLTPLESIFGTSRRLDMPAASEAIPIRVPSGAQRGEEDFVPCGVVDNDSFPLESVEDPPYFWICRITRKVWRMMMVHRLQRSSRNV
ncbi:hypothetical protein DINM_001670 [Dirofilaria immitis]|nr:hypothetical protein [Dirofilaria immitis]